MDEVTKTELDYLLSFFIVEVRSENGERFKGSTLKNLVSMIQHYYRKVKKQGWSIFNDTEFERTRRSLDLSMKLSREDGADDIKKRAQVIEPEHEEQLWEKNILGSDNPKQLVNTMIFLIGKNFGFRGRDEHRRLQLNNLTKHFDEISVRHYLLYVENISKTSKGGLHDHRKEPKTSRAYDNQKNSERCIVHLYDKYLSHRPDGIQDFYLTPLSKVSGDIWYKKAPLGVNSLANSTKSMFQAAGISGNFTNHSLKRTMRTQLCNDGFGRDIVKKKTGHISDSDLDYLEMNRTVEMKMSDSINFCRTPQLNIKVPSTSAEDERNDAMVIIEKGETKVTIKL